jgi:hypothetical protein
LGKYFPFPLESLHDYSLLNTRYPSVLMAIDSFPKILPHSHRWKKISPDSVPLHAGFRPFHTLNVSLGLYVK